MCIPVRVAAGQQENIRIPVNIYVSVTYTMLRVFEQ